MRSPRSGHARSLTTRRASWWACAAVTTLLAAACSSAPGRAEEGSLPASAAGSSASPSPSDGSAVLAVFDVGGDGWAMKATEHSLWIQVDPPVDAIVRVDKRTGEAVPMVPRGWRPEVGPSGLWVASGDWVVNVDPTNGKQSRRTSPGGNFALAEGDGWLHRSDGAVERVDVKSGKARKVASIDPDLCSQKDIAKAFGVVWLACKEGHVVRVPLDGEKPIVIPTALGSHTFAVTDDAVWVTNYVAGSISRIDPGTNGVTTIDGVGSNVGITTGGGFVWSSDSMGIVKIDPRTGKIIDRLAVAPGSYYELVWDDGVIWASTRGSRLLKIDAT